MGRKSITLSEEALHREKMGYSGLINSGDAVRATNKEIFWRKRGERHKIIRELGIKKGDTVEFIDGGRDIIWSIFEKNGLVELYSRGRVEP